MKNTIAKRIAVLAAIGTMTMASATAAFANDGMGIDAQQTGTQTTTTTTTTQTTSGQTRYVSGTTYYMALRNAPSYSASNEIAKLYNGDAVTLLGQQYGNYVLVKANGMTGYVDARYLVADKANVKGATSKPVSGTVKTVKVAKNYLALRSYPSFDRSNEIAKLYTGDKVTVISTNNGSTYWTVQTASGLTGYVNCNYLV